MITIFSSPKPFVGHIDTIQRNALGSWVALGQDVEVLLVGEEEGVGAAAAEYGARHLPQVLRNEHGTPLLNSIFDLARRHARHPLLCYVNADVILMADLLPVVRQAAARFNRFLLVGRRWDLDIPQRLSFGPAWEQDLRERLVREGQLHPPTGSDYFVYPSSMFTRLPPLALGRAGWDNWMIFAGRRAHVPVIDATEAVTVVHQVHDYSHLPDGKPHFRLPESKKNVDMVGGRAAVFTIHDTTWACSPAGMARKPWNDAGTSRALEAMIYAALGAAPLVRVARLILHPGATFNYYRSAVGRRLGRLLGRHPSDAARR